MLTYSAVMDYVRRWSDLMVQSTIPGSEIGLLPGERLVALYANLRPGTQVPYQTHPTDLTRATRLAFL